MASLNLQSPWPKVKELLKENDISLTDEDLQMTPGREDELLERLSKKMGKDKESVKEYVESISANTGRAS